MKFIKRKNIDTYKPKSQQFSVEVNGNSVLSGTKSLIVPKGTTAQQPGTPIPGMIRYNTETHDMEIFTDYSSWGWEKVSTDRPADVTLQQVGTGDGTGSVSNTVTITNQGTNYTSGDTITFSAPDVGNDRATGTITVSAGKITAVNVTNQGDGYITTPTISITTSTGSNAILTPALVGTLSFILPIIPVNSLGVVSATNIQVYVENVYQLPGINYTVSQVSNDAYVNFDSPIPFGKPVYVIYGWDI
jgi:hypothetical protein